MVESYNYNISIDKCSIVSHVRRQREAKKFKLRWQTKFTILHKFSKLLGENHRISYSYLVTVAHFLNSKLRVFWLKIAKNGVCCFYRYCLKLFGKMRREIEFRQQYCRNCKKKYNVLGEREN